ncbi:MAG: tryptophan synthase subunit alpha [Thermoplasmata archaeon]
MELPLTEALARRQRAHLPAVLPYIMVDRRRRDRLGSIVRALRDGGAAGLELGFPFSDPIADGPVLQSAATLALEHGTTWSDLLAACRLASSILPTAVMTYANPVYSRGMVRALRQLRLAGASAIIVPDLSLEEAPSWSAAAESVGLALVLLAAPGSAGLRVQKLARSSEGFLYLVSRYGTTGLSGRSEVIDLKPLVARAHLTRPDLPVMVGFGVRTPDDVRAALRSGADGVIVGSALEEQLVDGAGVRRIERFIRGLASVLGPNS